MELSLAYDLKFEELYSNSGLTKIDEYFLDYLLKFDEEYHQEFVRFRSKPNCLEGKLYSKFIVKYAVLLEKFLIELFSIDLPVSLVTKKYQKLNSIYLCKRSFIQKIAIRSYSLEEIKQFDHLAILRQFEEFTGKDHFDEVDFAEKILFWLENNLKPELEFASKYACFAIYTEEGQEKHRHHAIFDLAKKMDYENLLDYYVKEEDGLKIISGKNPNPRCDFRLAAKSDSAEKILAEANYCIYCHNQEKDSCSKGLKSPKGDFVFSPLKIELKGCPLKQKISEMNFLKAKMHIIGSLAAAMIDNPLLAATGHRICNDCMKSCIYQKQEPVNIPEIESLILKDVIELPWGFEIYSLLSRWNPLKHTEYLPAKDNLYKILIVGLGPAGFTLAHYLLNQGHIIVAIDGLKIEPLKSEWSGRDIRGKKTEFRPIFRIDELFEDLNQRNAGGFGGVEEYGITVRWNKNYLRIIRILLERRDNFLMFGSVRFDSNISEDQAWSQGFNHIAFATGAGRPNLLNIKNNLVKSIRSSSDFLMNLQLIGAGKNNLANLQLIMPVIVVGGGLTSIDSATEALTYYLVQIKQIANNYDKINQKELWQKLNEEEKQILKNFLTHAEELKLEEIKAKKENRKENLANLSKKWGGVKIIYRDKLKNSPAYRLNYEEIQHALDQAIEFIEEAELKKIVENKYGNIEKLLVTQHGKEVELTCGSLIFAIGTNPNNIFYKKHQKDLDANIFTLLEQNRSISLLGDANPLYAGSVVKAMSSAKDNYQEISNLVKIFEHDQVKREVFFDNLDKLLISHVEKITYLTENIMELVIKSPSAAREFQAGQFYKLQNLSFLAKKMENIELISEPLALTGALIDKEFGTITLIIKLSGASSKICRYFQKGDIVSLMGPTGEKFKTTSEKKVVLIGEDLGNATFFSIGQEMKRRNCQIIYFSSYENDRELYQREKIENLSDQVIWVCKNDSISKNREKDLSFQGCLSEVIKDYFANHQGPEFGLSEIDRVLINGSSSTMKIVSELFTKDFFEQLKKTCEIIVFVNSPMQCMMKEICAQCLQRQENPENGQVKYIYSCSRQDQLAKEVDFEHLTNRLKQNSLQEKITNQLIDEFHNNK